MDWTVYILECADATLYTGITNDLPRRLQMHESGTGAKYMRGRGPFTLIHTETHPDRSTASQREATIKSMGRAEKLALSKGKKPGF
ncbi:MAG: GIY-YIG nuclease family protein [Alphaproteobacteria bacterium]|nr:GIY-YIG nuclease family protein [Alphaproteobacteria bacterium]